MKSHEEMAAEKRVQEENDMKDRLRFFVFCDSGCSDKPLPCTYWSDNVEDKILMHIMSDEGRNHKRYTIKVRVSTETGKA